MSKAIIGVMFFIAALAPGGVPAYAEENPKLGKDDFVTTSINAVFEKLNQYSSGEKKILDWDEMSATKEKAKAKTAEEEKIPGITIRDTSSSAEKGKPAGSE
ncbi:MAG: hypothetical protein JW919_05450 [Candidatus Omnitrophica bacterium]|nr:hypothetical protein [Candidatus Omnitrophota bacterium]